MKKVPTLFERDWSGDRSRVLRQVNPACAWIVAGEGVATRKWDGTAVLVRDGALWRRHDARHGRRPPPGFEPADEPDVVTGHWPGWAPVRRECPSDCWFFTAPIPNVDGTYEFCGPKVQGNPEGLDWHRYLRHGDTPYPGAPTDYDGICAWLAEHAMEGLVWRHPDGRMGKVKRRDLGLLWPVPRGLVER